VNKINSNTSQHLPHLIRIPDEGVTEHIVVFADDVVLNQIKTTGERVLDIGCGRGVFTEKMAAKGALVTGIDVLSEEINAACALLSNVNYCCIAAENVHQLETRFDLIISRFCFHHLEFPKAAESIKDSLVPGGRMFIVDCYLNFWSLRGRIYVLSTIFSRLGPVAFFRMMLRLGYFFKPDRFAHVRSDIRRLKKQRRYTFEEVCIFYDHFFPDCTIDTLGCAFSLSWQKPENTN